MPTHKRWLPLEANPDVINKFSSQLGLDTNHAAFHDVFGLDEELLMMVPQPVYAVVMLFPITDESEAAQAAEEERIAASGQQVAKDLYYMKQTIGNACGTIGMLHSVCNVMDKLKVKDGSFFDRFYAATAPLDAAARGAYLEHPPEGAPNLEDAHKAAAEQGDTAPPPEDEVINLHFVAFVERDGALYELDGRKSRPINHGPTTPDTLLKDTCVVVRRFIETTNSIRFNLMALAAAS